MSGRKCISTLTTPVAAARLAPPAAHVEAEAPGAVAARARLGGRREQVANRGEQPRVRGRVGNAACARCGLWSMSTTRSTSSSPSIPDRAGAASGGGVVEYAGRGAVEGVVDRGWDFPDPDTPVTQVIRPAGISTSMPARLFPRAPTTRSQAQGDRTGSAREALRSCAGGERYCPVREAVFAATRGGASPRRRRCRRAPRHRGPCR